MSEATALRMTGPGSAPAPAEVRAWTGETAFGHWTRVTDWIEQNYPGVFSPEWLFGGKKHGWSLRYKKNRSFCTLIPEKGRTTILIVFGREEREKAEAVADRLTDQTWKRYQEATTYHDGKWLLLTVDSDEVLADVERLLAVKRKPRPAR
jgi:hypothetical protein